MPPLAKFKVKILIVPDGDTDQSLVPVATLFTPDLNTDPQFWQKVPNLISIEIVTPDIPECEFHDKINHDYVRLMTLLNLADSNTFVIYVRSTTVSLVPPNNLIKLIYDLCNGYMNSSPQDKQKFDVMYLAKWVDRCDQYTVVGTAFNNSVNLVETIRPNGLQSVLFSPSGAHKIKTALPEPITYPVSLALTHLIADGTLYALSTTPSAMNYNITDATRSVDYVKSHECADPPNDKGKPTPQGSNMSLFVFIIILIIVIAIFYFLITMVSKPKNNYPAPESIQHHTNIGTSTK